MSDYQIMCDVSGYQRTGLVPWADPRIVAGMVKCNEGNTLSKGLAGHTAEIRATGKPFGLYIFFRPDVDVQLQFDTFLQGAELAGYGPSKDYSYVIPAIDVERYHKRTQTSDIWVEPTPAWNSSAEALCQKFLDKYEEVYIYGGKSTWLMMGSPGWWLQNRLWVPRYNYNGNPPPDPDKIATPGNVPWDLAQTLVAPMFSPVQKDNDPNAVDQSKVKSLTLLGDAY